MNRRRRSLGGLCLRAVIVIGAGWVSMGAHAQEAVSAAPPSDEAACAPSVREALAESAEFGVAQDLVVIRDPEQGVGTPASIFDLSCLDDLFDYTLFNIHYDPARAMAELLGLAERYVCRRAHDAYRSSLGRRLDARVYTSRIPRLPGLDIDPAPGNILDDVDDVGGVMMGRARSSSAFWGRASEGPGAVVGRGVVGRVSRPCRFTGGVRACVRSHR